MSSVRRHQVLGKPLAEYRWNGFKRTMEFEGTVNVALPAAGAPSRGTRAVLHQARHTN